MLGHYAHAFVHGVLGTYKKTGLVMIWWTWVSLDDWPIRIPLRA